MNLALFRTGEYFFLCLTLLLGICLTASAQEKKKKEKKSFLYVEPTKQDIEGEYIDALKEKILGNNVTALALFAGFVKSHPEIAAGHFHFAELSLESRIYSQALPSYQKAVILEPSNKWYKVRMAELYDNLKMYKEAKEVYKKLADEYPTEIEFALSAAGILVEEGRLAEAIIYLEKIEIQIGVTKEINMEKYRLFMAQKKYSEALKELENLQRTFPRETLYLGMAAEVYHAKGDKKKALETYLKILDTDSSNTLIHLAIADYYQKENDFNKAFYHLEKAFENKDVEIDKKVMILLAFLEQSAKSEVHRKEGDKLTLLITEAHPEDPKSWSIRGDFLLRESRWREALNTFKKVIEIDPGKFIFFRESAQLCLRLEDWNGIKTIMEKAEELYPLQPEVFLFKGIHLLKTNTISAAEEQLNYGKELIVDNPAQTAQFLALLGTCAYQKNESGKANDNFVKSQAASSSDVFSQLEYARYLLQTNKQSSALQYVESAIKSSPFVPEGYALKGRILLSMNQYSEAERALESAFKYGGNQIKSTVLLFAEILEKSGNKTKAEQLKNAANDL